MGIDGGIDGGSPGGGGGYSAPTITGNLPLDGVVSQYQTFQITISNPYLVPFAVTAQYANDPRTITAYDSWSNQILFPFNGFGSGVSGSPTSRVITLAHVGGWPDSITYLLSGSDEVATMTYNYSATSSVRLDRPYAPAADLNQSIQVIPTSYGDLAITPDVPGGLTLVTLRPPNGNITNAQDQTISPNALALGYDIVWKNNRLVTTAAGDYAVHTGQAALRQAIYSRLITRPGEYRFRPDYGVGVQNFIKKGLQQATLDQLSLRIGEQLLQDSRISTVKVICERVVQPDGAVLRVDVKVTAKGDVLTFNPFTFKESA